jgi:hypothetical protein
MNGRIRRRLQRLLFLSLLPFGLAVGCHRTHPAPPQAANPAGPAVATPRLTVVAGHGDLGSADYGQKRTCTFTLRNDTAAPLALRTAEKSCSCAAIQLPATDVAPGATAEVSLSWVPTPSPSEAPEETEVRLWAEIGSADGSQKVRLEATGRLSPALRFYLPRGRLDFGTIAAADLREQRKEVAIEVYTQDAQRAAFTMTATTSGPGLRADAPAPLAAERLSALRATGGYRITLRAADGLPTGAFKERLRLQTSLYDAPLEIPVEGTVESGAVSVQPTMLDLEGARLSLANGYRCPPVRVVLRYEAARTLTVRRVEPAFLRAEARQVKENEWEIHVRLPAGEAEALKAVSAKDFEEFMTFGFSEGRIICETDHRSIPVLSIPIGGGRLQR